MIHMGECRKIRAILNKDRKILSCGGLDLCSVHPWCRTIRSDEKEAHKLCEEKDRQRFIKESLKYSGDGKTLSGGPDG